MDVIRSKTGVTLLELLVVVALIAVIAGFAFSDSGQGPRKVSYNAAVREIVSHINAARMEAIASGSQVLLFSQDGRSGSSTTMFTGLDRLIVYRDEDANFSQGGTDVTIGEFDLRRGARFVSEIDPPVGFNAKGMVITAPTGAIGVMQIQICHANEDGNCVSGANMAEIVVNPVGAVTVTTKTVP